MVCLLPAPQWQNQLQPGLQSATENLADSTIVLDWGDGSAVSPATSVHYLIYYSSDRSTLFDQPRFVTTNTSAAIPKSIADLSQYFAVRVAQLGVATDISSPNISSVNGNTLTFASPTTLRLNLGIADGYVAVDSTSGFPLVDGYVQVDDEIIRYSDLTTYMGGPAFVISDRDPFGCNTIVSHIADGYREVSLFKGFEDGNASGFRATEACTFTRPRWADFDAIGLRSVEDLGVGTAVELSWRDAIAPMGFSQIYYNVYRSSSVFSLLAGQPIGITTNTNAIDPNLQPGDGYYYSVRATYHLNDLVFTNFTQISDGFYAFPPTVEIAEGDGYLSVGETGPIGVSSTAGYPDSGQLIVGSEVLSYISKTTSTFNIVERDIFELDRVVEYPNGTTISFFKGIEDANTVFWRTTPTWDAGQGIRIFPPTPGDGYDGYQYLQAADGYRTFPIDNITEDHSEFEDENDDFDSKDYCGFRSETFVPLYQGNRCGSFHGGTQSRVIPGLNNGQPVPVGSGIDVFQRNAQRQEFLLGITGEPFVLLRRKWTGRTCPRVSIRHEHPHARCGMCFGTMFFGGYDRYLNSRAIRPGEPNPNGFIQMRVSPYVDDLGLNQDRGLTQEVVNLEAWTLAIPTIKDRDILIKYTFNAETGFLEEEFRYEVLSVQRNKLTLGAEGAQKVTMKRLNKTEEIYKFSVSLV